MLKNILSILIILSLLHGVFTPESTGAIQYTTNSSGKIHGKLVPDLEDAAICRTCLDYLQIEVDGLSIPVSIKQTDSRSAIATALFRDLTEGRHKSTETSLNEIGNTIAKREVLFIVDSIAPQIVLIEPTDQIITHLQTSFTVQITDEGSGIPGVLKAMDIEATINGQKGILNTAEQAGKKFLHVIARNTSWNEEKTASLHIKIKDRAGNIGEFRKTFLIEPRMKNLWTDTQCNNENSPFEITKEVDLSLSARTFSFPDQSQLTEHLELSFYYISPEGDYGRFAPDFNKRFAESIHLSSDNPLLSIERLPSPADFRTVSFAIRQTAPVSSEQRYAQLTLVYPKGSEINTTNQDLCVFSEEWKEIGNYLPVDIITRQTKLPVFLFHQDGIRRSAITIENQNLKYSFSTYSPGAIDTAASWLEIFGGKYWFNQDDSSSYAAVAPAQEGLTPYEVSLTSTRWTWDKTDGQLSNNGTTVHQSDEIMVTMAPPQISNFHYDRERQVLLATIDDEGTTLNDLQLNLTILGADSLPSSFTAEGLLKADFPLPEGTAVALLSVTDLAGQTTSAQCKIFGLPPAPQVISADENDITAKLTTKTYSPPSGRSRDLNGNIQNETPTGKYNSQGQELIKICPASKTTSSRSESFASCLTFYTGSTSFSEFDKHKGQGMSYDQAMMKCATLHNVAPDVIQGVLTEEYSDFSLDTDSYCHWQWRDTLPPRIRNVLYHPSSDQVTAIIDDHGAPLDKLSISSNSYTNYSQQWLDYRGKDSLGPLSFTFNHTNGEFIGQFPLPGEYERFRVTISVRDANNNSTTANLSLDIPRFPPQVNLNIIQQDEYFALSSTQANTYLLGESYDTSLIDHNKTTLTIDDQLIHPLLIQKGRFTTPDTLYYGVTLTEGNHRAHLQATDTLGLSSSASETFDLYYSPHIAQFVSHPLAIRQAGGPAFSALITDKGRDLSNQGIQLTIDDMPLPVSQLFYDEKNGYFVADGPLEVESGPHIARLTATDDHGHSVSKNLTFSDREQIFAGKNSHNQLSLDDVTLWELENHNGDGWANPGELVRLFIALRNNDAAPIGPITGIMEAEDSLVTIEQNLVDYGIIEQGTLPPTKGFDIRIDQNILDTSPSSPYEVHLNLIANVADNSQIVFPFILPIYTPSLTEIPQDNPIQNASNPKPQLQPLTIAISNLPRTTEQSTIKVSGTVTGGATIRRIVVSANGTPVDATFNSSENFQATVPLNLGVNIIEAQVIDQSRQQCSTREFITRMEPYVPPTLSINSPTAGNKFVCDIGSLSGTYNTGSSELVSMEAKMTGDDGVTVILQGLKVIDKINAFNASLIGDIPPQWWNNRITSVVLTVTMTTTDGSTATAVVPFTVECWW